nr:ribbon-helix-helix protein, CopG family [Thomasclavelia ramosa]
MPDRSHTVVKVKKTYRLEQNTIDELEELCERSGKTATEVIEDAIHDAIRVPYAERAGDGWAQTVAALTEQLAVKDDQIASLGRALEAAQETAKAAQALHAANVQQAALESSEQKERRRLRWPWDRRDG